MNQRANIPKIVTVHRGARDGYQVALALQESGLLESLVTDLYWPADRTWANAAETVLPERVNNQLRKRNLEGLPFEAIEQHPVSGLTSLLIGHSTSAPFSWKRTSTRWCDRELGSRAGKLATNCGAALLSYSYYAHSAFSNYTGSQPRLLFQLHPHPGSVRRILRRERELYPECAETLDREWELALPENEFQELVEETAMADYWLVASSFTKATLTEWGIPAERVRVIPYGTNLSGLTPPTRPVRERAPIKLLFVGTLCQRKGLKYLLEAVSQIPRDQVELTLCGRPMDDLSWVRSSGVPVTVLESVSAAMLRQQYREADVFVFPSLAEGFGHVLLEAMAAGLPIVSTDRTAAPDLIEDGTHGFLVAAGDPQALASAIRKFVDQPWIVDSMGAAARARAEQFTWSRFRGGVVDAVRGIFGGASTNETEEAICLGS